jgi:hypothetical protein
MHDDAAGPEDRTSAGEQDRGWGLQEEEGLFRTRAVELGDVVTTSRVSFVFNRILCSVQWAGGRLTHSSALCT